MEKRLGAGRQMINEGFIYAHTDIVRMSFSVPDWIKNKRRIKKRKRS